jgi:threonylcarbamoyladenosine tRNA methylthiotransferase MtaB
MAGLKYTILTFGCRVNQADSLRIEEQLLARGGTVSPAEEADVVVVNTCSVTSTADQAARQAIRRIARARPEARIVVSGCYATRAPQEVASLPNVLRVVRNSEKLEMIAALASDGVLATTTERFGNGDAGCGAPIEPGVAGRTALFLRVQTGCDQTCSYCIIPSTRGPGRSVPLPDLLGEVRRAIAAGYREISLTGVHLGSYGRDLGHDAGLFVLLRALADLQADVRFRISSLEPMDCTPEIVGLVASEDRFAPHFHLPLQHASDRILTRMRRPYALAGYRRLVDLIRSRIPHAAIGSDVIVGFPGETCQDFDLLVEYLAASPLTTLHVFAYSDRPGTPASAMGDRVHGAVVRERGNQVRVVGERLARSFRASQLGTIRPALALEDGTLALTDNYLKLRIPPGRRRNEWVMVRIGGTPDALRGEWG